MKPLRNAPLIWLRIEDRGSKIANLSIFYRPVLTRLAAAGFLTGLDRFVNAL
jgi:hypothetical protein